MSTVDDPSVFVESLRDAAAKASPGDYWAQRHWRGDDFAVDWTASGIFGWADRHGRAVDLAILAALVYRRKHRVYRSVEGDCWMIRRIVDRPAVSVFDPGRR